MVETIFAQATAVGRAGVSVIRISGPKAFDVCRALAGDVPETRYAAVRCIADHQGKILDEALVLVFEGPASFTGEDVVELHLHGSIAIVKSVLAVIGNHAGCRHAEAGEFTRRAMENGRLDLTQVEALSDLIDAETEAQRKQAMDVLSGQLGSLVDDWRSKLVRAAALLEATIDFADEEVPEDVTQEVMDNLESVADGLSAQISGVGAAERIKAGFEVAIIGAPNVGKSTLLNRIAGREAAITSSIAGTTRDVIEVKVDLDGLAVTFLDTAGLRNSEDEIEKIGIAKAQERADRADLVIYLREIQDERDENADIQIYCKGDLAKKGYPWVSGSTGQGVKELLVEVYEKLSERVSGAGLASRQRHLETMQSAASGVEYGRRLLSQGPDSYDLVAEEIRTAARALEILLGRIDVEDLLDEIFSSFCVGK